MGRGETFIWVTTDQEVGGSNPSGRASEFNELGVLTPGPLFNRVHKGYNRWGNWLDFLIVSLLHEQAKFSWKAPPFFENTPPPSMPRPLQWWSYSDGQKSRAERPQPRGKGGYASGWDSGPGSKGGRGGKHQAPRKNYFCIFWEKLMPPWVNGGWWVSHGGYGHIRASAPQASKFANGTPADSQNLWVKFAA